jgi:hypothetical protein
MVQALNIAANGLIQSEKRATRLAQDIVSNLASASNIASDQTSFTPPTGVDQVAPSSGAETLETNNQNVPTRQANAAQGAPSSNLAGGAGFSDVIQQLVDLRSEENVFKANAAAFSRINETFGTLLDEEG